METGERLAAYAAGELDADETRALEAELAREPSLRARLASIRETDSLLADLDDVEPRPGFSSRLRETVSAEMASQLGSGPDEAPTDELTARRDRRDRPGGAPRWTRAVAAAAAIVAVGGVGAVMLPDLGGADTASQGAADESTMETMAAPEAASGPTVVSAGRIFSADDLQDVAADERFDEILAQELSAAEAPEVARLHEDALAAGDGPPEGSADAGIAAESGPREEEAEGEASVESAPQHGAAADRSLPPDFGLRTVGDISEAELADVRRCLPQLLDAPVIPVYAELITFDANAAIVYGLVGNDPEQDSYRRVELWVVGRGDCQVLHLEQVDR